MLKCNLCGFGISCWVLASVLGLTSSTQTAADVEGAEAEWSERAAVLEQLRSSSVTTEQLQKLLELATRATQTRNMPPAILIDADRTPASPGVKNKLTAAAKLRQLSGSNSSTVIEPGEELCRATSVIKMAMGVIVAVILVYELMCLLVHFGILPKPGFKAWHHLPSVVHLGIIGTGTLPTAAALLHRGAGGSREHQTDDQAWTEQLGLCETEFGKQRWLGKSATDPAEPFAHHASTHMMEDACAWPGYECSLGPADVQKSSEEKRVVGLQRKFLERERYVTVFFRRLFLHHIWSEKPGSYPGPPFQTREEFVKGCQPGRWPLASRGQHETGAYVGMTKHEHGATYTTTEREDTQEGRLLTNPGELASKDDNEVDICEVSPLELVRQLRNFIWRNNPEASWKATIMMVFLGASTFPSTYLFGRIVEDVSRENKNPSLFSVNVPLSAPAFLMLLILLTLILELFCSYLCYKFATVVPKYGVLRQFQSLFGRQCMKILMTQTLSKSETLKSAHEDLFSSSPGLCQAMTNYCCEIVVLNLWGKVFDRTRAITTLVTSVCLVLYSFLLLGPADEQLGMLQRLKRNMLEYGSLMLLFMLVNFFVFLMNVLSRLKESVDMWGAATKTKLNMMSLQQELTVRMMRAGKNREGPILTSEDQHVLDEACSDWHNACRIYGNRDFHTWFVSWIITENSNSMIHSVLLAVVMVVLGGDALAGDLEVGTFVMLVGAVRSMNEAFSSMLMYYFSVPEGYICLLYLAQVCNMA